MSAEHAKGEAGAAPAEDPEDFTFPHGSKWPFFVGMSFFAIYLAAAFGGPLLPIAFVIFLVAGYGWIREDVDWYWNRIGTGPRNGWIGTILFLCTEVMLFGALFATYFVARAHADVWPFFHGGGGGIEAFTFDHPTVVLGFEMSVRSFVGINTLILLSSGATMHWAHSAIRKGNYGAFKAGLWLTLVLGSVFLGFQIKEYVSLFSEGITLDSGAFASTFFSLTGTHGFHVLAGLLYILIVAIRASLGTFSPERHVAVETCALYWHFVDVVWVVLYAVIYLGIP